MKLILTREVGNLGSPGDIVEVKDGYGRNYLVPQGYAIAWSRGAEKQIDHIRRAREVREIRDLGHAKVLKAELEGLSVTVTARAGASGQLFGRVSDRDVAAAIKKAGGPDLDRHRIQIADPIKHVGDHRVAVALHPEVTASVALAVTAS
jgi:large subunit ribosomal protein L9